MHIDGMEFRAIIYNAARDNNLKRLKIFLDKERTAEWFFDCLNSTRKDRVPLVIAARFGHLETVKYLVSKSADPNVRGCINIDGEIIYAAPPLWVAAAAGHLDVVKYLVEEAGADVNLTTSTNSTSLRSACYDGHLEIVKYLVEKGADIETANRHGHTPLMIASFKGKKEVVRYLLDIGADVSKLSSKGNSALHDAAEGDNAEICEMLLDAGAEIVKDDSGMCPLMHSALLGNESTVPILLERSTSNIVRRDALKLLGCTRCDKKLDMTAALETWREAISIPLTEDEEKELEQQISSSSIAHVYGIDKELQTVEDIDNLEGQPDEVYMQSLLMRERIVGGGHGDVHYYLRYRGAIYCDLSNTQRCFELWLHALYLQQKHLPPIHVATIATFHAFQETFMAALNDMANRLDQRFQWFITIEQVIDIFHRLCFELERLLGWGTTPVCEDCLSGDHDHDLSKDRSGLVLIGLQLIYTMYRLSLPSYSPNGECPKQEDSMDVRRFVKVCSQLGLFPLHLALEESENHLSINFPCNYVIRRLLDAGADVEAKCEQGNTPLHVLLLNQKPRESIVTMLLEHGAPVLARDGQGNTCMDLIDLSRLGTVYPGRYLTLEGLSANVVSRHMNTDNNLEAMDSIPLHLRHVVSLH